MPDDIDLPKVPKQWIVNVCAAVIGEPFKQWVHEQIEERNALMSEKKEVMIAMDLIWGTASEPPAHVPHALLLE